jgi:hypothetical protein
VQNQCAKQLAARNHRSGAQKNSLPRGSTKSGAQKKQLAASWRGNRLRREEERHRDPIQPPSLFGKLWVTTEMNIGKVRKIVNMLS